MSKSPNRSVRLAEEHWAWLEQKSQRSGGISINELLRGIVQAAKDAEERDRVRLLGSGT